MGKITMQDIANSLSISRVSVWRALNNHPGVSEELREEIEDKATELGFYQKKSVNLVPQTTKTVSVVVTRPESSLFWTQIIHQMARYLSLHDVNLLYTYLPVDNEEYKLPSSLQDNTVDGAIILNAYSKPILQMLANLDIPKIFLDTIPSVPFEKLNGTLVLIEGRDITRQITLKLLEKKYKKIGFVGDITYAQTNLDRYNGFVDAHQMYGLEIQRSYCLTSPLGLDTHYQQISEFLENMPDVPDAFVCTSDYIAHFIKQYFIEHDVPEHDKVILTGFDNNAEYTNIANKITTVEVQTGSLGQRLASKIIFSMDNPGASHEVSYITSKIIYKFPIDTP